MTAQELATNNPHEFSVEGIHMTAQIDPQVNPAKPLKNVRQEQVLLKILAGESNTRAYQSVYKCKNDNTAGVLCNRLLRNVVPQEKLWVDFDKEVSMRQPSS